LPISLGVPYHSWRITHAKHHASTGHMTQDQVFVPRTRTQRSLPPLNPEGETLAGASISQEVLKELYDALGDSPIGTVFGAGSYLVCVCAFCSDGWK
jgi:omega-6 fatty acid desaturase (delta-12 desaturase)